MSLPFKSLVYPSLMVTVFIIGCIISCDNSMDSEHLNARFFIRGEMKYMYLSTQTLKTDTELEVSITYIDNATFNDGLARSQSGSEFVFGPLVNGEYKLEFKFEQQLSENDSENVTLYEADVTETIDGADIDLGEIILEVAGGRTQFIQGNLNYIDILTNESGESFSDVKLSVKPVNDDGQQVGDIISMDINSNFFTIGPLNEGTYEVKITNTTSDNEFNQTLIYQYIGTHTLSDATNPLVIDQSLSWKSNTALLLQITDSLDNAIEAGVCYYTNSDFLDLNLPTCGGSISDSISTIRGRMLFQNLDKSEYFFNVSTKVGTLVLNNHDSIYETKSEVLSLNSLNTHTITLYKD